MIMLIGIAHFKGDRNGRKKRVVLIGRDVEHQTINPGGRGFPEVRNASLGIGNAAADLMPSMAGDEYIELDGQPLGCAAEGGVEDMRADHHRAVEVYLPSGK